MSGVTALKTEHAKRKERKANPAKDPLKAGKQMALKLNALVADSSTEHMDMQTILHVHEVMGYVLDRLEEAEALLASYALNCIGIPSNSQQQRQRLAAQAIIADYERRHPRYSRHPRR